MPQVVPINVNAQKPAPIVDETLEEETPDYEVLRHMQQTNPELLTSEEERLLEEQDKDESLIKSEATEDHYKNLAGDIDENTLKTMAEDIIGLVEDDLESRKDWHERVRKGIKNLGVSDSNLGEPAFEGASEVVHPVLMEACTQFQSRAVQEMWPSEGPVQTKVLGVQSPEKQDQAERVQNYMNYLYTIQMTEAFNQEDTMLLRLPISGSTFKKLYYCPLKKRLTSMFVEPADFIISYSTYDMASSPRYTHRIREYINDVRKKERSGHYVKSRKKDSYDEDNDKTVIHDEIDKTEGKNRTTSENDTPEDRATMYEVYIDYSIEDPKMKEEDTIFKPYIITIDRDQKAVKRVQRNWKPDDENESKRVYFVHYKFTPGLGFYGFGLLHLIGDMAATATGALRALLDSASFANLQGGFKSRDSRVPSGSKPIAPGEWREVNTTAEDLSKAFHPLQYKEPSPTLFNLLGYIDDKAKHLAGITETVTGESNPKNAPVGTTAMLLEQGAKVFTSIHKRLHEAHKQEFKIMAELIEEYMPDEGYPYLIGEAEGILMPEDFDEKIDVVPISDPNISSNAQRVAKAQSILELQQQYPDTVNEREAVRRMLEAIQAQNIDMLIGSDEELEAKDKEMAEKQELVEAIERRRIEAETAQKEADVEKSNAITVREYLSGMEKAFDVATMTLATQGLIPVADSLMKSAGFEDKDGSPLTSIPESELLKIKKEQEEQQAAIDAEQQEQLALEQPMAMPPGAPGEPQGMPFGEPTEAPVQDGAPIDPESPST